MSDHIDRAAEVLSRIAGTTGPTLLDRERAEALDAAGRLVTPEHDRAVAARALREAADAAGAIKVHAGGGNLVTQVHVVSADALRARADRIEAGESDAHA